MKTSLTLLVFGMSAVLSGCGGADSSGSGGVTISGPEVTGLLSNKYQITCAVVSGAAKCWGLNTYGGVGDNSTTDRSVPTQVVGLTSGVTAVAAGGYFGCAIVNGALKCWGRNGDGQLGNGTTTESHVPVSVTGLSSGVSQVAAGGYHACAITSSGGVKCWGQGTNGQLGDGLGSSSSTPVSVPGLSSGVVQLALGAYHSCALLNTGGVKCWGAATNGVVGDGTATQRNAPVDVTSLTSGVAFIGAGRYHTCAITTTGAVWCWGRNYKGQLGTGAAAANGSDVTNGGAPVLATVVSGASSISGGYDHTCAVVAGGVKCWGLNQFGDLGNNSTTDSLTAVQVAGLSSDVLHVTGGQDNMCALLSSGAVKCWGQGDIGQLGNGVASNSSVPVQVSL